jgi:nucleoside-diphosphate-sugar epimerase
MPEHPKLRHTRADLRDPEARRALEGVDVLWHLGAQLWRDRAGGRGAGGARGVQAGNAVPAGVASTANVADTANVAGTANVIAARPGHVVFASSAAVYGAWPDNPVPIAEDHEPRPNPECPYAVEKLAAEGVCADACPTAVLRISAVLGPHADPLVRRAAVGYRRVVPAVRGLPQALQFLDEDDAADALHRAGMRGATGVLNLATPDWLDAPELAGVSGGRVVSLPRRLFLAVSEAAYRFRLLDFGADRAVLVCGPLALDCGRAAEVLGWRAQRGSAEVLRDLLFDRHR